MSDAAIYHSLTSYRILAFALGLLLMTPAEAAPTGAVKPRLDLRQIHTSYLALARLQRQLAGQPERQRVIAINHFFNRFRNDTDQHVWGQAEFWATPQELFTAMAGDCEDIAVAKYFALLKSGIDERHLRLAHVKAYNPTDKAIEDHLVLLYLDERLTPHVLDNLTVAIRPLQARRDLVALYSFNRYGVWNLHNQLITTRQANTRILDNWRNMLARLEQKR